MPTWIRSLSPLPTPFFSQHPCRVGRWRAPGTTETDAAFTAGIALKSLDDLVRSEPTSVGCWRARQTLKCATVAVRLTGRNDDETAFRDAVLLTIPAPPERCFRSTKRLRLEDLLSRRRWLPNWRICWGFPLMIGGRWSIMSTWLSNPDIHRRQPWPIW